MASYKSFNVCFRFPYNCIKDSCKKYIDYTVQSLEDANQIDVQKSDKIDLTKIPYYTRIISAETRKGDSVIISMNKVIVNHKQNNHYYK